MELREDVMARRGLSWRDIAPLVNVLKDLTILKKFRFTLVGTSKTLSNSPMMCELHSNCFSDLVRSCDFVD